MEHIAIIGNGIAGITAARHIRKSSDKKITVISGESDYFFSRTALMYVYMGHLKWDQLKPYEDWFWKKNRIDLKHDWVEKIDFENKILHFSMSDSLSYDKLILATGSLPKKYGWEGQDLKGVQGLVTKQDLESLEENTRNCKKAVIVGGGLIGVEMTEMLKTRKIEVTVLVKDNAFWGNVLPEHDAKLISEHIRSHGVDLRHNTRLDKILSDENGRARAVVTAEGEEIECQIVGICTGVQPNIEFLRDSKLETDKGILVDPYLQTNMPDVYAIGDCVQQREPVGERKAVEPVWYSARMMGETLAVNLTRKKMKWNPGNWFNSAKFFDIEYQTYGWVWSEPRENEKHVSWAQEDGNKFLTIAYKTDTEEFYGINTFGIRLRHEVIDRWLTEKRSVSYVLKNLKKANFDPEFYKRNEKDILNSIRKKYEVPGL